MCWICDPIGETSKTLNHIGDVIANDPIAQAAVLAAGVVATGPAGFGLWGSAGAATTAAEIGLTAGASSGAATLVPLEAVAVNSWGPVASVTAGTSTATSAITGAEIWGAAKAAGGYAVDGLNVAGKVAGGLNALSLVASKPANANNGFAGSVKSVVPQYGVSAVPGNGSAQTAKSSGIVTAGSVGAGESGKAKDSTLTMLASGLTIAAIVYQFWGK